jgi:hypothetical protein
MHFDIRIRSLNADGRYGNGQHPSQNLAHLFSRITTHFVINYRQRVVAIVFGSNFVIQLVVKHFFKFLANESSEEFKIAENGTSEKVAMKGNKENAQKQAEANQSNVKLR